MTRWIVTLLLGVCVTVVLASDTGADDDKVHIDDATCQALANQVKAERGRRWPWSRTGPKHYFCQPTLEKKKEAYCNCKVVPRKRDDGDQSEFLKPEKAGSFLESSIGKRDFNHECCKEGCYWEEVEEQCH
ncbi:uncharacterized protein LOC110975777 [Acanthaster planci]|uniref:Uncharacterized protein LOC110975777 n=1 Tax=Acanthaster planci TaxID=133434 RepID=A0A8B7XW33_ACAPL|nr:uncharacterized protein LOC110975777 [Acanthaster planci]